MRYRLVLAVVLWAVRATPGVMAGVQQFSESFNGNGAFSGFDNPGWDVFGEVNFQNGAAHLEAFARETPENPLGVAAVVMSNNMIEGSGGFVASIDFDMLSLDDWETNVFAVEAIATVSFGVDLSPAQESRDFIGVRLLGQTGAWSWIVSTPGERAQKWVSEVVGGHPRLEIKFDEVRQVIFASFDANVSDARAAELIGPLSYKPEVDADGITIGVDGYSAAGPRVTLAVDSYNIRPLAELPGDFDGNGQVDLADIMALRAGTSSTYTMLFDMNMDGYVNEADVVSWVHDVKHTFIGDANLDGRFSSSDLINVFQMGGYEDAIVGNATWSTGDWNGDAEFDRYDLVLAFQDGGYERGSRQAVSVVPEPDGILLLFIAVAGLQVISRK